MAGGSPERGARGERERERRVGVSLSLSVLAWDSVAEDTGGWWGVRCRGEVKLKRWLLGVMCGGGGGALYSVSSSGVDG
jgi:hypothetical protein